MKLGQGIKGSPADYEAFWSEKLPTHLEALERLCSKRGANGFGSTPGALYLWSILHQLALVSPDMLAAAAGKQPGTLAAWYASLLREPKVQKVLSGESSMGELRQYFVAHEPASGGSKL